MTLRGGYQADPGFLDAEWVFVGFEGTIGRHPIDPSRTTM